MIHTSVPSGATNGWAAFAIAGSNLPFYDILSLLCLDPIFGNHMV